MGKSGCLRAKAVVFGQKLVLIWQDVFIRAKWFYSGKICFFWGKVVVFGQSGCIRTKLVVFE